MRNLLEPEFTLSRTHPKAGRISGYVIIDAMQLLHRETNGDFYLREFNAGDTPPYAILSHRWLADEPKFQDITNGTGKDKAGYSKLEFCAQQAAAHRLKYFWIDTVCIDRSSSAVLSESLISMYHWYQEAERCYVYLTDVSSLGPEFEKSNWFTRGWTLQELIAPKVVEFYSSNSEFIGTRASLMPLINKITGIPLGALRGDELSSFSLEEKLSWAQGRQTLKPEDMAYCQYLSRDRYAKANTELCFQIRSYGNS